MAMGRWVIKEEWNMWGNLWKAKDQDEEAYIIKEK